MYAYCNNNPVAFVDETGAAAKTCLSAEGEIDDMPWKTRFGERLYHIDFCSGRTKTVSLDYTQNTSIDIVLWAEKLSYYNGATVIKFSSDFISSFAFGNYIFINQTQNTAQTVKHEYGHVAQARDYGLIKYAVIVFVPSVTYNVASRFSPELNDYYFSMPWEYDAEIRGGNNRGYASWAESLRDEYFKLFG